MVKWILLLEGVGGRKCYYMQASKKLKASWAPFSIVNFLSKAKKKSEKKEHLLFLKQIYVLKSCRKLMNISV